MIDKYKVRNLIGLGLVSTSLLACVPKPALSANGSFHIDYLCRNEKNRATITVTDHLGDHIFRLPDSSLKLDPIIRLASTTYENPKGLYNLDIFDEMCKQTDLISFNSTELRVMCMAPYEGAPADCYFSYPA